MPSTVLQGLSKILLGITFPRFIGYCGIKWWKFKCMPTWCSASAAGDESRNSALCSECSAGQQGQKQRDALGVSGFSLLLLRQRMRKINAELRSCKRTWLGLIPKSEQGRTHAEIRIGNAAIGIRDDRKIGGVWIWVGVGDRKKRGRIGNLKVMCRRETGTDK